MITYSFIQNLEAKGVKLWLDGNQVIVGGVPGKEPLTEDVMHCLEGNLDSLRFMLRVSHNPSKVKSDYLQELERLLNTDMSEQEARLLAKMAGLCDYVMGFYPSIGEEFEAITNTRDSKGH